MNTTTIIDTDGTTVETTLDEASREIRRLHHDGWMVSIAQRKAGRTVMAKGDVVHGFETKTFVTRHNNRKINMEPTKMNRTQPVGATIATREGTMRIVAAWRSSAAYDYRAVVLVDLNGARWLTRNKFGSAITRTNKLIEFTSTIPTHAKTI